MSDHRRYFAYLKQTSNQMQIAYWLLALLVVTKFTISGLGNDFEPFYKAGVEALHFTDPWIGGADYVYSAYINGPLTLMTIMPFSIFGKALSLLLLRASTVACLPLIIHFLGKILKKQSTLGKTEIYSASCVLLFTFPVRSNLEYGQFFIIISTLVLGSVSYFLESKAKYSDLLVGMTLSLSLDFKPQVFTPLVLFIFVRKPRTMLGLLPGFLLQIVISLVISPQFPFESWLDALRVKKEGGFMTIDQMNVYAISQSIFFAIFIVSTILFSVLIYMHKFSIKPRMDFETLNLLWLGWFLFIPYLHPTDLVIPIGVLSLLIFQRKTRLSLIALGAALVWSNSISLTLVTLIVISVMLRIYRNPPVIFLCIPNAVFIYFIKAYPQSEIILRQAINYSALVVTLFVLLFSVRNSKLLSNSNNHK